MFKHLRKGSAHKYVGAFLMVVWVSFGQPPTASAAPNEGAVDIHTGGMVGPLMIGPIPGLTTSRHIAPAETAVPLGTVLEFEQHAHPGAIILWTGAEETYRDAIMSRSRCPMIELGESLVEVEIIKADGERIEHSIALNVVDVPANQIAVGPIKASVDPMGLNEQSGNMETMHYYFNYPSVAALREIGTGRYSTSVDRDILLKVAVEPAEFAPIIEWRIDGRAVAIGRTHSITFDEPGRSNVSVGPPTRRQVIVVDTYAVEITSHRDMIDIVPEGEPITFEAITDPPGFEDDITWISSTKYGTATPVLGEGPTFTVIFEETFGITEIGERFQWLGVRADNAQFGQDQKTGACCMSSGTCLDVTFLECANMQSLWMGAETTCDQGSCFGPCCLDDECSDGMSRDECELSGGAFFGEDNVCADVGPQCANAACDPNAGGTKCVGPCFPGDICLGREAVRPPDELPRLIDCECVGISPPECAYTTWGGVLKCQSVCPGAAVCKEQATGNPNEFECNCF